MSIFDFSAVKETLLCEKKLMLKIFENAPSQQREVGSSFWAVSFKYSLIR